MCRFVVYLGPPIRLSSLLTEPNHSLIRQSYEARERPEPLNGDGFGVAWYAPEEDPAPAVFRSVTPAWNNRNLLHLSRVVRSACVLAHVRAATATGVNEANCHPFVHGRYAFMHNGDVANFQVLRRTVLSGLSDQAFRLIEGSTDSEHLFAMFIDEIGHTNGHRGANGSAQEMADAVRRMVARVLELARSAGGEDAGCYLNMAVSDGESAVVTRYSTNPDYCDSLHLSTGLRYVCEGGVCRMEETTAQDRTVIVSSEALSSEPGWSLVPQNHLVMVDPERHVSVEPLGR